MTLNRDTVTDVVRFDGIHKVVENVYEVTKSKIHSDVNIYTLSHKVTHYTAGTLAAHVVEFPTKCHVGRNNAELHVQYADGSFGKTRTYKRVDNAHAKAIEFLLDW